MNVVYLRRLVIIVSVISLFLLSIYTYYYSSPSFSVYDFVHLTDSDKYLEKTMSLSGTIREPIIKENHLFFELCSGSTCVFGVIFNYKDFQKQIIFNNQTIKVTGKYTIFNNQKEIIVSRLDNVNT